jgi:hypothetical protein
MEYKIAKSERDLIPIRVFRFQGNTLLRRIE